MSPRRSWLLVILILAFVLRATAAVGLQWILDHRLHRQFLIEGDAEGYWWLAQDIAAGRDFAVYDPPRYVLRMPGFPALLAVSMRLFGDRFLPARLLLAAVGTAACGLVYWLGRELTDIPTALTAALLAAMSPVMIGFTPLILSETAFAAALLLSLVAMARLVKCDLGTRRWPSVAVGLSALRAGGAIALGCYVRPSWLLVAPGLAGLYVWWSTNRQAALQVAVLVGMGTFVALLPWGLRNQRVTGHLVLTTLWAGPSLYDGLNPEASGDSNMAFYDRDNLMRHGLSEYEVDRHYRRLAWEFVRANPYRTLELAGIKLWRFWKPWPNADQFGHWAACVLVAAWFMPMLLLAIRGGWLLRTQPWTLLLTAGPILYFTLLHMVFVSSLRYRLPAEYPLLVLSAVGLRSCCSRFGHRVPA